MTGQIQQTPTCFHLVESPVNFSTHPHNMTKKKMMLQIFFIFQFFFIFYLLAFSCYNDPLKVENDLRVSLGGLKYCPCNSCGDRCTFFFVTLMSWMGSAFDDKLALCCAFFLWRWQFLNLPRPVLDWTKPRAEAHYLSSITFILAVVGPNIAPIGGLDSFCIINKGKRTGDDEPTVLLCSARMFWYSLSDALVIKQSGFSSGCWYFTKKITTHGKNNHDTSDKFLVYRLMIDHDQSCFFINIT